MDEKKQIEAPGEEVKLPAPKAPLDLPNPQDELRLPAPKRKFPISLWIFISLLSLLIIGIGANYFFSDDQKLVPPTEPTVTPISSTNNMGDSRTYESKEVGIAFSYPTEWGDISVNEELCLPKEGYTREYNGQPCVSMYLLSSTYRRGFLVATSKLFPQYIPGRGAIWGDEIIPFISDPEMSLHNYCTKNNTVSCESKTNQYGVGYIKSITNTGRLGDTGHAQENRKSIYYFILNKNRNFPIVELSSESLPDSKSLQSYEKDFDQILSTFKFTDKSLTDNQTSWDQKQIHIGQDNSFSFDNLRGYSFTISLPSNYSVTVDQKMKDVLRIHDEQNTQVLSIFNYAGGERSPVGNVTIDSVPFTLDYSKEITCLSDIYPTNWQPGTPVLFNIHVDCTAAKPEKILTYRKIIQSIKFNSTLKKILSGENKQ